MRNDVKWVINAAIVAVLVGLTVLVLSEVFQIINQIGRG